jgi:C_GCAxxG_C_C family probable redox protein
MEKVKKAAECFESGFSCSQAVLATFAEEFNLDKKIALKISSAFCGGMGGTANVCGAVTGGLMVIGLKYGRTEADDVVTKEKTNEISRLFMERFKENNGSLICKDLLGADISTIEGKEYVTNNNLRHNCCTKLVENATEILEKILTKY